MSHLVASPISADDRPRRERVQAQSPVAGTSLTIVLYHRAMPFEWDEDKRQRNLAKHGIDFAEAEALFDGRPIVEASSRFTHESRVLTTGLVNGRFYTAVWTRRGNNIRIISARRARDGEERTYRAVHA